MDSSVFTSASLMCLIMDPFFKHYTPQLAHNCCPCPMNYALCEANTGSQAPDKSQAVEEAGVITKTILRPWGRGCISCLSSLPSSTYGWGPSPLHRASVSSPWDPSLYPVPLCPARCWCSLCFSILSAYSLAGPLPPLLGSTSLA